MWASIRNSRRKHEQYVDRPLRRRHEGEHRAIKAEGEELDEGRLGKVRRGLRRDLPGARRAHGGRQLPGDSREVQEVIRRHHQWLKQFWTPTRESYAGHSQLIVDSDLRKAYEAYDPRLPSSGRGDESLRGNRTRLNNQCPEWSRGPGPLWATVAIPTDSGAFCKERGVNTDTCKSIRIQEWTGNTLTVFLDRMRARSGTAFQITVVAALASATLPIFGVHIQAVRRCPYVQGRRTRDYPRFPTSIGEHLRKRRLDLNLRQIDAAKLISCDELTVVDWEKGRAQPSVNRMAGVVKFLGYNPIPDGDSLAQGLVRFSEGRMGVTRSQFGVPSRS